MDINKDSELIVAITDVMEEAQRTGTDSNDVFNQIDRLLKKYYDLELGDVKMDDLVANIEKWSIDKKLDEADSSKQFLKVAEEFGEIGAALARGNEDDFKDAVGDTIVTLIILAQQNGTNVKECLEVAYNEIKGRKGKTVNGVFIKESDL